MLQTRHIIKLVLVSVACFIIGFTAIYYFLPNEELVKEVTPVVNADQMDTVATSTNNSLKATATSIEKPELETFKLKVPYFRQQHVNTCEAASLRMALAFYGINKTDMEIVNAFGYDPKLKDVENNIWDDPQKMFVGFVDLASSTGGYGTYGLPVVKAAESFGRTAIYSTSVTPKELATEVRAGNPVVIWGYTSLTQAPYTWNLRDGGTAKAFHGEHARLVVGVYGDIENPTGFFVHDSLVGAYQYWTTSKLMKQFNSVPGVTNQLVVVK